MKIPVFVSRPNLLTPDQEKVMDEIFAILDELALEPRTLGQSDYPTDFPLKEARAIIRHCSGGLVIGFAQEKAANVERYNRGDVPSKTYPTPWNHLEAGILFASHIPMLIWREPSITGGVFDNGVTGNFVHAFEPDFSRSDPRVRAVFSKWQAEISRNYYEH
ncbi:MAG: hypothetical protein HRT81_06805 [Henriciella sp.]|nr:hypothetical protein [Henriciella sp.]